jgi:hypothetical protein
VGSLGHTDAIEVSGLALLVGQAGAVRRDLSHQQWDDVASGELVSPDSRRFSRRTTRAKRREGDELITAGAPLVAYYWAAGQLDWFDGADASEQWQLIRPHVTAEAPQPNGKVVWTAGRWEDADGRPMLFLTGHC